MSKQEEVEVISSADRRKKEFAKRYATNGKNATKAAMDVFPNQKYNSAAATGSELLKNPKVQKELALVQETIDANAPGAIAGVIEMMHGAKSETVRLTALKFMVNLAGYTVKNVQEVNKKTVDINELIKQTAEEPKVIKS